MFHLFAQPCTVSIITKLMTYLSHDSETKQSKKNETNCDTIKAQRNTTYKPVNSTQPYSDSPKYLSISDSRQMSNTTNNPHPRELTAKISHMQSAVVPPISLQKS